MTTAMVVSKRGVRHTQSNVSVPVTLPANMPTQEVVEMALSQRSLAQFTKFMWKFIEPQAYISNWHIDCICDHLEAVSSGEIKRVLFNMPPRMMKSLTLAVFYPMWDWLHNPWRQFLFLSYAQTLSTRDSVKCRNLFNSPLYQAILQYQADKAGEDVLTLKQDGNEKTRFYNSKLGYRLASSLHGLVTGEGGHIVGLDDAHNMEEAESDKIREKVIKSWRETLPTRLHDQKTGAFILAMQRAHSNDVSGWIIANEENFVHVCLPAEYEGKNRIVSPLGWKDPRKKKGEPLCVNRLGRPELIALKKSMGAYATAGQLQQNPAPRTGGFFEVDEVTVIDYVDFNHNYIVRSVRYWDKAGTDGGGCRTAGVLMHWMKNQTIIISDIVMGQWSYAQREKRIKQVAAMDAEEFGGPASVQIWVEQEGGSGGKESAESTIKNLMGYSIHKESVTGDKEKRAGPFSVAVENGYVMIVTGPWLKPEPGNYLDELQLFPNGTFKDQVDASSGAYNKLMNLNTKGGVAGTFGSRNRRNNQLSGRQLAEGQRV